jgi:hypothetical protein
VEAGGGLAIAPLHVASTPVGAAVTVSVIFLLIFAMSFAFGPVPEGGRRFSAEWSRDWLVASAPRMMIAGVFAGLVLIAALSFGNSSSQEAINCERGVPPLTGGAVTEDRVANAIAGLAEMESVARGGDSQRVSRTWLTSDAHNLTHDIDGPLRRVSPERARTLCENVVELEDVMTGEAIAEGVVSIDELQVVSKARAVAGELERARDVLDTAGALR